MGTRSNQAERTARAWLVALLGLLLLGGCIKQPPVVQSAERLDVAMAVVMAAVDEREVGSAPARVVERVSAELESRNLRSVQVGPEVWAEPFTHARSTPHRASFLAEQVPNAEAVLLVEGMARFSEQINGRYRWTIAVDVTLGHPEGPVPMADASFTVPVALVYAHEGGADALLEAGPVVARRVGALLDGWIGARQSGM